MSITVVRDETYAVMWRVRLADGRLTDMVNLTRAKDAARYLQGNTAEHEHGTAKK